MQKPILSNNLSERLVQLQDPWNFLATCIYTKDEVDAFAPVKPAPIQYPYIYTLTRCWQHYPKLIIDKSRRMWISWLMLSLHLHLGFTATNRRIGIVSKKFEDACAHLESMKFLYRNIPEEVYPAACRPTIRAKEGFIYFDEIDSVIHALASGPDQARQYGFSALFFDEMDFWPEAEDTYGASLLTIQGGGKFTAVSTHDKRRATSADSFFLKLVDDAL